MIEKQKIQYVLDGESVNRTVTVTADRVTRHHVTAHKTGKVECEWVFDFSAVPQDAILELASRAVLIGSRPTFKKCPTAEIPEWLNRTISVKEFISRERTKADPKKKLLAAFDGLSDEDKAEMLERLQEL